MRANVRVVAAAAVFSSAVMQIENASVADGPFLWGSNQNSESSLPPNLGLVRQVSLSDRFSLALGNDGRVIAWGINDYGQCNLPASVVGVQQVSAGAAFGVALLNDQRVICWGANNFGQCNVPAGLTDAVQVAAGNAQVAARRGNGTVVCWGNNNQGQCNVPAGLNGVTQVDSGANHIVVRKSDGTAVCWGDNAFGQRTVPAGLTGVVQVAGGGSHTVALKSDGTVRCWGNNGSGQSAVPAGLTTVTAISAGGYHTMALKADGTVVAWGGTGTVNAGQSNVPASLPRVIGIDAGGLHSAAWVDPADCNVDGVLDAQQVTSGALSDYNGNNVPDCCETGTPCEVGSYPVQWRVEDGGNGHWYQRVVGESAISWNQARERAIGLGGHLATIASQPENDFVFRHSAVADWTNRFGPWLGGYQDFTASDYSEPAGGWRWVTGEPWGYTAWSQSPIIEPNNGCGLNEDSLHFINYGPRWNDLAQSGLCPGSNEGYSVNHFMAEWSADCNNDGIVDYGQIMSGQLSDANGDGIPNICQCPGDVIPDEQVNGVDLAAVLGAWGTNGQGAFNADIDGDGVVSGTDLAFVLGGWGPCQ